MYREADADVPLDGFEVNERLPAAFLDALTNPTDAFSPRRVASEEQLRRRLTKVRALINQIDDSLGRILERFDLARTLVWFTSDHGDYAGHRGMLAKFPWIPFDDLARVPLVIAGLDLPGGRRVGQLVQSCDFALTALDYAGIAVAEEVFDSRSLRPLFADPTAPAHEDRAVLCGTGVMGWPTLRRGALKYVTHTDSGAAALFDLNRDPGETTNVLEDPAYRSAAAELSALLADALDRAVPDLPTFEPSARP
jgi:arylsulfatase A-like enzyme